MTLGRGRCQLCHKKIPSTRGFVAKYCSQKCARKSQDIKWKSEILPMSTSTKGAMGELIVSADLISKNCHVFRSQSPNAPFDIIAINKKGKILKIEVTVGRIYGEEKISYTKHDPKIYDVIAVVIQPKLGIKYFAPDGDEFIW